MRDQTRQILELFVEKADLLETRSFVKHVTEHGITLNLRMTQDEPTILNQNLPDDEALAALMVTFRMFIQDNDSISLRNLGKLMDDPGLSGNWKAQVKDVRDQNNVHLNNFPPIAVDYEGVRPTSRELLEVFVYGDLAHTSQKKRQQFLTWKSNPFFFQVLQYSFHEIVVSLLEAIHYIAHMTRRELAGEEVPCLPMVEQSAEMNAQRLAKYKTNKIE